MTDQKYEKSFKLDMNLDEALARLGQTDTREVQESIAEEAGADQVRLVSPDDTGDRFLIYGTDKGVKVALQYDRETFWATQKQMTEMFGRNVSQVSRHIKKIFEDGELPEEGNLRKTQTATSTKPVQIYSLDMVISVAYRVTNSKEATMFRIWSTDKLVQILTKGFYVDVERLKSPDAPPDRIAELREIIKDIRADESNIYREVRQLCALCQDYSKDSWEWKAFFARMQNKIFWATVQMVATQLRLERVNADGLNMGLETWAGDRILQADTLIAKNCLGPLEVEDMNDLSVMLLDFFRDQLKRHHISTMAELEAALDKFVRTTNRKVMPDNVDIPTKTKADKHCKEHYKRFKALRAMQEQEPDTRALSANN